MTKLFLVGDASKVERSARRLLNGLITHTWRCRLTYFRFRPRLSSSRRGRPTYLYAPAEAAVPATVGRILDPKCPPIDELVPSRARCAHTSWVETSGKTMFCTWPPVQKPVCKSVALPSQDDRCRVQSITNAASPLGWGQRPRLQPTSGPRSRCGTRSGRRLDARSGRRSWCSCRSTTGCNGCCWRGRRCSRSSRRWRRATAWRYTNEIDILFMLSPARVEVKSCGIGHVATGVIRHDGDVIAYLVLLRPAFQRSEGLANRHIGCPRNTAVGAIGIKQLRVGVIGGVS